jgi:hypothetical protein
MALTEGQRAKLRARVSFPLGLGKPKEILSSHARNLPPPLPNEAHHRKPRSQPRPQSSSSYSLTNDLKESSRRSLCASLNLTHNGPFVTTPPSAAMKPPLTSTGPPHNNPDRHSRQPSYRSRLRRSLQASASVGEISASSASRAGIREHRQWPGRAHVGRGLQDPEPQAGRHHSRNGRRALQDPVRAERSKEGR